MPGKRNSRVRRDLGSEGFIYASLRDLDNAEAGSQTETVDGVVFTKLGNNVWLDEDNERVFSSFILSESPQLRLVGC